MGNRPRPWRLRHGFDQPADGKTELFQACRLPEARASRNHGPLADPVRPLRHGNIDPAPSVPSQALDGPAWARGGLDRVPAKARCCSHPSQAAAQPPKVVGGISMPQPTASDPY